MPETVPIAGVVLRNQNNQYLLVQERKARVYGLWNWPAGHVDTGETPQEAAVREAEEETGLKVRIIDPSPIYKSPGDAGTNHVVEHFLGEVIGGALQIQDDELLDARWFKNEEIKQLHEAGQTRGPWVMVVVNKLEGQPS